MVPQIVKLMIPPLLEGKLAFWADHLAVTRENEPSQSPALRNLFKAPNQQKSHFNLN